MNVEITPEPSEEERQAILAALAAQEPHTGESSWTDDDEQP